MLYLDYFPLHDSVTGIEIYRSYVWAENNYLYARIETYYTDTVIPTTCACDFKCRSNTDMHFIEITWNLHEQMSKIRISLDLNARPMLHGKVENI